VRRLWVALALLQAGGLAVLAGGCENPFDPAADVRLIRLSWTRNGNSIALIEQATAYTNNKTDLGAQSLDVTVGNFSSVPAVLTRVVVVYKQVGPQTLASCPQPAGSPICSLGGAGGRRWDLVAHVPGLVNNFTGTGYTALTFRFAPIHEGLLNYIQLNPETTGGGIDLEITMFGEDHNGHDVRVNGTFHIEVY
jgi:hypothetical protein